VTGCSASGRGAGWRSTSATGEGRGWGWRGGGVSGGVGGDRAPAVGACVAVPRGESRSVRVRAGGRAGGGGGGGGAWCAVRSCCPSPMFASASPATPLWVLETAPAPVRHDTHRPSVRPPVFPFVRPPFRPPVCPHAHTHAQLQWPIECRPQRQVAQLGGEKQAGGGGAGQRGGAGRSGGAGAGAGAGPRAGDGAGRGIE
jgi:hypothetical protein